MRLSFIYTVSNSDEAQLRASLEMPPEEMTQADFEDLAYKLEHNFPNILENLANTLAQQDNAAELLAYLEQITYKISEPTLVEDDWTQLTAEISLPGVPPAELHGLELDMLTSVLKPPWDKFSQVGDLAEIQPTDAGWQFKLDVGSQGNALLDNFKQVESSLSKDMDEHQLADLAVTYTITLPGSLETTTGKVIATGAGSTTVSWQLFPVADQEPYLQQGMVLETSTSSGEFPLWLGLVLAGVGVLLVLTLLPSRYRRRWLTGDFSGSKLETGVYEEGEEISMADPAIPTAREPD